MSATVEAVGVPARTYADIELKVASSRAERRGAFELTYRSYLRAGLCQENATGLRVTPYQLLSTTDVMVARLRGEVISTLSLVRDGELGLPLEEIYPEEVEVRRTIGYRLAEVSCLADRRSGETRYFRLFCDLAQLMVQLAVDQGIDQLLVAVHPRHAPLYRRYMAFEQIGENRAYEAVCGNPAVAMCLDLNEVQRNHPPNWSKFFGEQLPPAALVSQPMTDVDRLHFSQFLEPSHSQRTMCA